MIWCPNDFPYFVEPGIEHHVTWVSGFADAPLGTHPEIVAELERQRPAGSWYATHHTWQKAPWN